ncbi:hypothetical protein LMG31884_33930 [Xanthomonas hydrangeae]|nr:hypothetical protein LMG31884_33930 [Xanthomonas hydrangeae]CAD7722061.1 hypothetical protein LMG31884_33930 [Xanthomonas hydrangeae]CAD7738791.1 hypothetical protein LMG31887_33830 [Xanthomonas hydrangeae]CAD7738794.1 hypothetical protein LMG31887_33830 [Xanthomonas hydrangeae]
MLFLKQLVLNLKISAVSSQPLLASCSVEK